MIRDPFDVHRNNVLGATAARTGQTYRNTAGRVGVGAEALDMSFSRPKHVPNFGDPNRDLEDRAWASVPGTRRALNGVQERVTNFFDGESLPMYKDKPYGYPPSLRSRSWWRRKRLLGTLVLVVLAVLYFTGALTRSKESSTPKSPGWSWLGTSSDKGKADWNKRRERVVEAFELSWDAYERNAWGYDEYHPVSKTGKHMAPEGLGWIIIDSLDTMMLMNLTSRLQHAREWLSTSLTWEQNQDVSTFETTIRMLGGLLSAHYLSTEFPDLAPLSEDDIGKEGEDLYLEKAKDLADRLLAAFESQSGLPYASVNLEKYKGIPSHADMGASSTAEATSVQLEFKYMAKLTGEQYFWDKVEKPMKIIDENNAKDGIVPIFIYPENGEFRGNNIRLGSRGDSYYEYLIKQYLQTNKKESVYEELWEESLAGVRKHLVTYTQPSGFTIIGERPDGLDYPLSPKMDHLVCFYPGTVALAATGGLTEAEARKLPSWSKKNEADMEFAREVMHTCWGMYKFMATGLSAEITYFNVASPPPAESAPHTAPVDFDPDPHAAWRKDYKVKPADVHNLQRPETVESLFYMWRITGDVKYREWGWEMFKSFVEYTAIEEGGGFTGLSNANVIPPKIKDNMESFWLAETLKYFYLLFSPDDLLPLDKIVLNTEGHPLPRFDIPAVFDVGWQRRPRDAAGNVIAEQQSDAQKPVAE